MITVLLYALALTIAAGIFSAAYRQRPTPDYWADYCCGACNLYEDEVWDECDLIRQATEVAHG